MATATILNGASSFYQYNINNIHITYIGEYHWGKQQCRMKNVDHITIEKYVIYKLTNNPYKVKILLEYPPENIHIGEMSSSKTMKSIIKKVTKDMSLSSSIEGFDVRTLILPVKMQILLYYNPDEFYKLDNETIKTLFLDNIRKITIGDDNKLYVGYNSIFDINASNYNTREYNYIQSYISNINDDVNIISEELTKLSSKSTPTQLNDELFATIRYMVMNLWKKVSDFGVIRYVMKKDIGKMYDEIIIVAGEEHAKNFYEIFKKASIFSGKVVKQDDDSVCVYL